MYAGSILSGSALDYFTTGSGDTAVRHWQPFWLSSAAGAAVILLIVVFMFRSRAKIQTEAAA
jgi:hypothetical protein